MRYPTIEQVDAADHMQICMWYRNLSSPGSSAIGKQNFDEVLDTEGFIMNRIADRLKKFGGFTTEISKAIGWGA